MISRSTHLSLFSLCMPCHWLAMDPCMLASLGDNRDQFNSVEKLKTIQSLNQ